MAKSNYSFFNWLRSYKGQKIFITLLFLFIPLALLVIFTFIPFTNMLEYSFQKRDLFGLNVEMVGFNNYVTILTNPDYFSVLKNSLYYMGGSVVQMTFALLLASILCSKLKFRNFFKGVLFFPFLMNGVAVSLIFRRFFQRGDGVTSQNGTLNSIITFFGGDAISFLSDPVIANICLVFASVWKYIGFDIVMFIGAIQSINTDITEAAYLDGANAWQKFRYIVFPSIKPIIALQLILSVKGAFSVFEMPYIITGGKMGTGTFVIKTIETAFVYKKIGLASALAVVLLIIIIIITIIQKLIFREDDEKLPRRRRRLAKNDTKA